MSMQSQNLVASSKHLCVGRSMDNYYEKILNLMGIPHIIVSYLEWKSCLSLRGALMNQGDLFYDAVSAVDKELNAIGSLCKVLQKLESNVLLGDHYRLIRGALRVNYMFGTECLRKFVWDILYQCLYKVPAMVAMQVPEFKTLVQRVEVQHRPERQRCLIMLNNPDVDEGLNEYWDYLETCANNIQRDINMYEDEQSNIDNAELCLQVNFPVHEIIQFNQRVKYLTMNPWFFKLTIDELRDVWV